MKTDLKIFQSNLAKYDNIIVDLLGNKYGITSQEFIAKTENAIKKNPELLKCSLNSLFGSILYFAEIGLPFNSPEGYGFILPNIDKNIIHATPIIGYKGLIEIAYRSGKIKSIKVQAVYENDEFSYEYGTDEYLKHKPKIFGERGSLICVYAIAKLENLEPLFVVVNKEQLDEIQNHSKTYKNKYSIETSSLDVFNIMQCKIALKLLFKMLPKSDNKVLINALELDNKFDYDNNIIISATNDGYELIEKERKSNALEHKQIEPIEVKVTDALKEKQNTPL
jgi:phage RecT family recombinase